MDPLQLALVDLGEPLVTIKTHQATPTRQILVVASMVAEEEGDCKPGAVVQYVLFGEQADHFQQLTQAIFDNSAVIE
jgi:hypothetical protein